MQEKLFEESNKKDLTAFEPLVDTEVNTSNTLHEINHTLKEPI